MESSQSKRSSQTEPAGLGSCDDGVDRLDWNDNMDGVVRFSDDDFDKYWGEPVLSIKLPSLEKLQS